MQMVLPPTEPSVPYTTVRAELATGDLFFLHGKSQQGVIIERLEERAGLPPYSHIAMVIKDGDDLFLWDAPGAGDCFPDPYSSDPDSRLHGTRVHTGCRVSVLDDVLAYYSTKVHAPIGFWVRQLSPPLSEHQFAALRTFINRADGLPFPGYAELGMNYAVGQLGVSLCFGTYFCSQLVADSYLHAGVLEMAHPPNAYTPAAFAVEEAAFGINTGPVPLVPPATLGKVFFVKWDRQEGHGCRCEQEAW
ncbi:MAG: hypothetical protein ACXVR9_01115 [Gaiellaceae bacterium]